MLQWVMAKIKKVRAEEVFDSRGNPTVKARVELDSGEIGEASVPSGASTGSHEALELRDGDKARYNGKGVLQAVKNVEEIIGPAIIGMEATDQEKIDQKMISLDGTENKSRLGANAILAVSLACSRAAARGENKELYQYLREKFFSEEKEWLMPEAMMNVLNGGRHAQGAVEMQEFMIVAKGESFEKRLKIGKEVYESLKKLLTEKGLPVALGDEGGFTASFKQNSEALENLIQAIKAVGYEPGKEVNLALDPAASEFFKDEKYILEGRSLTSEEMIKVYEEWVGKYPISSIEDGLAEDDWPGWQKLTAKLGSKIQIVGDDLYVTNVKRLERGIKEKSSNAILIKLNQIGTLTETIKAIKLAKSSGMKAIVSHRSGETEDTFISDLVVAANTGQIKAGAPSKRERMVKYERLVEIERQINE